MRAGCVRACPCTCARVSACACVRAFPSDCIFARVCLASVCARLGAARALPSHGGDVRYQWLGPRRALRPRVRGCVRCHRPGSRASAAGVTWTSRTPKAPWAERAYHTSVVDAAGAIYVIGGGLGDLGTMIFQDVWASTDGGARAGLGRGGWSVVHWVVILGGYSRGHPRGTEGYSRDEAGALKGYSGDTAGILRSSKGVLRGLEGGY
jgi:hypothetical protein